jgi:hypothetical protein
MVVDGDDDAEDPEGAGDGEALLGWDERFDVAEGAGEGHWKCRRRLRWIVVVCVEGFGVEE